MENFLILAETETNAALVAIHLVVVAVLLLFIAWVYQRTHNTLSYSQSSVFSMVLMGVMSSAITMVVTQNIFGAFAFFIIFTLIRFRSVMKETRDAIFLLLGLAIGVTVGKGAYAAAISVTLAISFIILAFNRWGFYRRKQGEHMFVIHSSEPIPFDTIMHEAMKFTLRESNQLPDGTYKYALGTPNNAPGIPESTLRMLQTVPGIKKVEFVNKQEALEY